jgi:hypothetical protein
MSCSASQVSTNVISWGRVLRSVERSKAFFDRYAQENNLNSGLFRYRFLISFSSAGTRTIVRGTIFPDIVFQ